ncbi:MAG: PmoA family protein [Phycisphaerales bacterium]|nr:MAG: PmoA family protein [Phycisphaerales bacterium]
MSTVINSRRDFLKQSMYLGVAAASSSPLSRVFAAGSAGSKMKFGLVTYLWGQDWDLGTLIANCEKTEVLGVELRTEHAHGVESSLNRRQRREVKKRFADSPVTLLGPGTNFAFHHTDPAKLRSDIDGAKEYIKLSYDCGGTGIKVKPNDLPKGVPHEKTIEQIGKSLNELGRYAAEYDQMVRVEVHGRGTSALPVMKAIMDVAEHPNVGVCWNCNSQDLDGEGLEYNFNLVKDRFADTVHIRELNVGDYPYQQLMNLFVKMDYNGWVLLEARTKQKDRVRALAEQRHVFQDMVAKAQATVASRGRGGVKIDDVDRKLRVEINGKLFTEYNFQDVPKPFFYPVIGPTGVPIIRHWPMKEINPDEARDHPHQKSLWFTHGEVNGHDFWGEGRNSGKIVHDRFVEVSSGPKVGVIKSKNKWVAKSGEVVCTDTRTHRFYSRDDGQLMDFEITIYASEGKKVVMGDTKEGSMAIRLAPTMREEGNVAQGHIVNSEGHRGELGERGAWGKRAKWCDCYGPVEGETVGVAIFDHPSNPKHPTWWHVRGYGLLAANPFGVHDFEKKEKGVGDISIPAGDSLTFKYRFYFHKGDEKQGKVEQHYREYEATK